MLLGVNHTSFTVADVERSVDFYTNVLGGRLLSLAERPPDFCEKVTGVPGAHLRIAYVELAGYHLELIQYLSPAGEKADTRTCNVGSAHVAFNVSGLRGMYRELKARGVRFMGEPVEIPAGPNRGGHAVYFEDPDENTLEFIEKAQG
ncbi:MAG: VOC family protein [Nitrospinota bacterium]